MFFVFDIAIQPPVNFNQADPDINKPLWSRKLTAWAGLWIENNGTPRRQLTWSGTEEKEGFKNLFQALNQYKNFGLIHFNGRQYHLPLCQYKAMQYELVQPQRLSSHDILYRYSSFNLDLSDQFSNYGATPSPALSDLVELLGLPLSPDIERPDEEQSCFRRVMVIYVSWLYLQYTRGKLNGNVFTNLKQRAVKKIQQLKN